VVDIEFVAQMLQLVHGGREPRLRISGTLPSLVSLREAGLLGDERFAFLERSYRTLRAIEGRLRLIDAAARHDFPESGDERRKLAHLLGYADTPALVADVEETTSRVRAEFNAVFDETVATA
jgi:glutamate-ammonia-ligase adenylyltransferase